MERAAVQTGHEERGQGRSRFRGTTSAGVRNLDAVFCVLFYHDLFWLNVDRDKMNRAAFRALKSGGVYAIIDHSAREGAGANDVKTLHRIERRSCAPRSRRLDFDFATSDFLKNPNDTRDWNDSPGRSRRQARNERSLRARFREASASY